MKWIRIILVAIFALAAVPVSGEQENPWSFDRMSIITLPVSNVEIRRSIDRKAVELKFSNWNPEIEKQLSTPLSKSSLSYRLYPMRQTAMAVEIYSKNAAIDFAARHQKNTTHVLVGEIRPGRIISQLLIMDSSPKPLSKEIQQLIRENKLVSARDKIRKLRVDGSYLKFLLRMRLSIVETILYGVHSTRCPLPPKRMHNPMVQEGVFLLAWYLYTADKHELAQNMLVLLRESSPSEELLKRGIELEKKVAADQILAASRADSSLYAAAYSLRYMDTIRDLLNDPTFFEVFSSSMATVGLDRLSANIAQREIVKAKRNRQIALAPLLVESYFGDGQYIRALDAATYYLVSFSKIPEWSRMRLLRIRGLSNFQEGNWQEAVVDLTTARESMVKWDTDDELSFVEARLRAGGPITDLGKYLNKVSKGLNGATPKSIKSWIARLRGEIELRSNRIPKESLVKNLPFHILFKAAKRAEQNNRRDMSEALFKHAARGKGGWSQLAEITLQVSQAKNQLDGLRKELDGMPAVGEVIQ